MAILQLQENFLHPVTIEHITHVNNIHPRQSREIPIGLIDYALITFPSYILPVESDSLHSLPVLIEGTSTT